MCCENPTDLGCVNTCDDIVTTVEQSGIEKVYVRFMFNGSEITHSWNGEPNEDGFLVIPPGIFNETAPVTFAVYDQNMTLKGCFKVKVGLNAVLPVEANEDEITLSTTLEYIEQFCQGGDSRFVSIRIVFSNPELISVGTILHMTAQTVDGNQCTFVAPDTSYFEIDETGFPVLNTAIVDEQYLTMYIVFTGVACTTPHDIEMQVTGYSQLPENTVIGTNELLTVSTP